MKISNVMVAIVVLMIATAANARGVCRRGLARWARRLQDGEEQDVIYQEGIAGAEGLSDRKFTVDTIDWELWKQAQMELHKDDQDYDLDLELQKAMAAVAEQDQKQLDAMNGSDVDQRRLGETDCGDFSCGGGVVGDGKCRFAGMCCTTDGYCVGRTSPDASRCNARNCGNGHVENGYCGPDSCCNRYGYCYTQCCY